MLIIKYIYAIVIIFLFFPCYLNKILSTNRSCLLSLCPILNAAWMEYVSFPSLEFYNLLINIELYKSDSAVIIDSGVFQGVSLFPVGKQIFDDFCSGKSM